MYIVIGGGGVLGSALGAHLVQRGHEVVVLEIDRDRCENVLQPLGVVPIVGSATDMTSLERAGIRKAEAAIAVMGRDADNLAFCLLARHMQVPRVMTRMMDDQFRTPLEIAGAHLIFSDVEMVLSSLLISIELPDVTALMRLRRGNLAIIEVQVPANAQAAGRTVRDLATDIRFPRQCLFVGLTKGPDVTVPTGSTVVEGGGAAILVCAPGDVKSLVNFLTERRELEDSAGHAQSIRTVLRGLEFLAPMTDPEIEALARRSRAETHAAGTVLFRRGQPGSDLYILVKGKMRMALPQEGRSAKILGEMAAPDFFGEFSVLTGQARSADAEVVEDVDLIAVPADSFRGVLMARPDALLEVTRRMSERTRENRRSGGRPAHEAPKGGLQSTFGRIFGRGEK